SRDARRRGPGGEGGRVRDPLPPEEREKDRRIARRGDLGRPVSEDGTAPRQPAEERRPVLQAAGIDQRLPDEAEGGAPERVERPRQAEVALERHDADAVTRRKGEKVRVAEVIEREDPFREML